ncbi:MAG: ribonuclease P protein component [Hyphomicrobiaceae bacterium]|jgi:ribonuclease P protein component
MDRRFPKEARLRKRGDYLRVQAVRRGEKTRNFVVLQTPARTPVSRIGITVTKRIGGAVERNRVKRRVREFFRNYRDLLQPPRDIVVIARTGAHELSFKDVESQLAKVFCIDRDASRPC